MKLGPEDKLISSHDLNFDCLFCLLKVDDLHAFGSSWRVAADPPAFVHTNLIDTPACIKWPENLQYAKYACSSLDNDDQSSKTFIIIHKYLS